MKDFWDVCSSYYDLACNDDVEAEEAFFPAWVDEADAAAGPIPSGGREELPLDGQQIIEDFLASWRRPGDGADVHSAALGPGLQFFQKAFGLQVKIAQLFTQLLFYTLRAMSLR